MTPYALDGAVPALLLTLHHAGIVWVSGVMNADQRADKVKWGRQVVWVAVIVCNRDKHRAVSLHSFSLN